VCARLALGEGTRPSATGSKEAFVEASPKVKATKPKEKLLGLESIEF
jgi:hypothetical protein